MSALPPCSTSVDTATKSLVDAMIEAVDRYCALPEGRAPCTLLVTSRWLEVGAREVEARVRTWCAMQGQPDRVRELRSTVERWDSETTPGARLERVLVEIDVDKRRGK